jgi:hypothetical protein
MRKNLQYSSVWLLRREIGDGFTLVVKRSKGANLRVHLPA